MAKIFVVEDSRFQRNRIREVLASEGHEIREAVNGLDALRQLEEWTPDCIISDLLMPEMDGLEFLEKLRSQGHVTPVIVHTADIQESVKAQCEALGASAFLQKPLNKNALLTALKDILLKKKTVDLNTYRLDNREVLTEYQIDILQEFINIGVGRAAAVLTELVGRPVKLKVPSLLIFVLTRDPEHLDQELSKLGQKLTTTVELEFHGDIEGRGFLSFAPESSLRLLSELTGESPEQLDLETADTDALLEVGNIVLNGVVGSISNILGQSLKFTAPSYHYKLLKRTLIQEDSPVGSTIVLAETTFVVEEFEITGQIFLVFDMDSFKKLIASIEQKDQALKNQT